MIARPKGPKAIHGHNPMDLVEKILQTRIFRNSYWNEKCYGLTEATLTERAIELEYIGGTYGGTKTPTPFICLILAMLHLQPDTEIVKEFIVNNDYKYVRALGAFYMRLTGSAKDVFEYLEPLLMDYRKLKTRTDTGYKWIYMDEFIDTLLTETYCCDIALPFVGKRAVLEESKELQPRKSVLENAPEYQAQLNALTAKKNEKKDSDDDSESSGSENERDNSLERQYEERSKREKWRSKKQVSRRSPSRSRSRENRRRDRSDSRERYGRRSRDHSRSPTSSRRRDDYRDRRRYSPERRRRSSRSPSRSRSPRRERRRSHSRDRYSRSRRDGRSSSRDRPRGGRDSRSERNSDTRSSRDDSRRETNKRKRSPSPVKSAKKPKGDEVSLSVSETNALRAKLGLPPLK